MHYLNRLEGIKRAKRVIRKNPNWKDSFKILIKTRHPCSCDMCARDRNVIGKTMQEKKMDLELERTRYRSKKKRYKDGVVIQYRYRKDLEQPVWRSLYPTDWTPWHKPYANRRTALQVIERQSAKFNFLEFKIKGE